MLLRKLARSVRNGRLVVRGLGQPETVFGCYDETRPDLDVVIRIRDPRTAWRIAARPDLYLGEAYMNGSLVIERGDLRSFLELCYLNFRGSDSRYGWVQAMTNRILRLLQQRNGRLSARRNAAYHYDLSGEF